MLIFLVWYVQRITKTLASPGLLGTSVQCMVLYWLLVEICWTCTGERIALPAYPFICVWRCHASVTLSCTHGQIQSGVRVTLWDMVFACFTSVTTPHPRLCVPSLTHTLLQFDDRSFIFAVMLIMVYLII